MSELDWSGKGIGDCDLLKTLYDVRDDIHYEQLYLNYNKLTSIVDLRTYRQFENLKVLNLWHNNITDIDFNLIPSSVTWLDLSYNKLTHIGHLNHCTELKYLSLEYNQISNVDWKNLPIAMTWLHIENNQLTTVGNVSHCAKLSVLSACSNHINNIDWKNLPPALTWLYLNNNQIATADVSHCTQLKWLHLEDNPTLHCILSLPNKDFGFSINSSVKVLGQKCFHEKTYNKLRYLCKELRWKLEEPPVEVLLQGLEAMLEYYKEKPVRTTQTRYVLSCRCFSCVLFLLL